MEKVSAFTDLCTLEGLFRYGTKAGGVAPTPVTAEWLNMMQAELVNFVLAFLPGLDVNDNTQVLQAARALISGLAVKAESLAGYGILDAYTKAQADLLLGQKATKATSLGGYGILDAYTSGQVNELIATRAATADSLAGYGILDAYTKAQADLLLGQKATKATSLAGYGVTDAYTKTEIAGLLALKQDRNTASFGAAASWTRDAATGAMEQFGTFNMGGGANEQTITFPVAFPNASLSMVLCNIEDSSPAEGNNIRILRRDRFGATILNSGGNTSTGYDWIVKGY